MNAEERFWTKVDRSEGPDACWVWTKSCQPSGYGQTWIDGKVVTAHRAAWIFVNGLISSGMLVCHTCDNRKCCNPSHLFLGTYSDNNRDMFRKGRGVNPPQHFGENAARPISIDTYQQVLDMLSSRSARAIARTLQIGKTTVLRIKKGKHWRQLQQQRTGKD